MKLIAALLVALMVTGCVTRDSETRGNHNNPEPPYFERNDPLR